MADKKISELVSLAGKDVAATDLFPVVDVSVSEIKSLTRDELRNAVNAIQFAATKALATTAAASLPDDTIIEVAADESLAGARTRYTVAAGALVFAYEVVTKTELDSIQLNLLNAGLNQYTGAGQKYPLAVDASKRQVLWWDAATQKIAGEGLNGVDEYTTAAYAGAGIYPLLTNKTRQVLLGYDQIAGELVGAFPASGGLSSATNSFIQTPLPVKLTKVGINHLLFYGESYAVASTATPVLSVSQPYGNLTFSGGPRAWNGSAYDFASFKPLVEDAVTPGPDGYTGEGETGCSGAANYATTQMLLGAGVQPSDHVILASTAGHGSYTISQLEKGTAWYASTFVRHPTEAKALNSDYAVSAICMMQGANDAAASTPYATWRAKTEQWQADAEADIKAISGQTTPIYCIMPQLSYKAATWPDQALAQIDLVIKNEKFCLSAPTYMFPHAVDNVHLTNIGQKWHAGYVGRAYAQLFAGFKPEYLKPLAATVSGSTVRVRFAVPRLPLLIDTALLSATTNSGFKVTDGGVAATISSITLDGSDVVIALSTPPAGAVKVRYALDYLGAGLTITNGASGNLRDSTDDVMQIGATEYPLPHVCPAFELTAITIGY